MKRASFGIVVVALVLACGDGGPASLTITLDKLPEITNAPSVKISGSLTRVPAKKTTYVVTLTGGLLAKADTVDSAGHFSFILTLKADSANSFSVSATDEQHSTSPSVTVNITQDQTPPDIANITPKGEADQVPRSQVISFLLTEPAAPRFVTLLHQGVDLPGTLTMAADSVNGTFTPGTPLSPNSIYTFFFVGLKDRAGNQDTVGSCFVTTAAGASNGVFTDPAGDGLATSNPAPPSTVSKIDILEIRMARNGADLTGLLKFSDARSLDASQGNNVSAFLDFDTDQNPATGFVSTKDTIFTSFGSTFRSGIGADYTIQMLAGTGGIVGQYTSPQNGPVTATFGPDLCGPFMGFEVPFTFLGNDDGSMDLVAIVFAGPPSAYFTDPAPDKGHYTTALPATAPTIAIGAPSARAVSVSAGRQLTPPRWSIQQLATLRAALRRRPR